MFLAALYNKSIIRVAGWVLIAGCAIRVITNYLYGLHYTDEYPVFWENLYFRGQSVFELMILMSAGILVKRLLPDHYFLAVSYFTDLAVYAWIKEFVLNPLDWQVWEFAGFIFSLIILFLRLTISRERRNKLLNFIKLTFR